MEAGEKAMRHPRREYTPELKGEIVARCRAGDRTTREIARDFDLTESAV